MWRIFCTPRGRSMQAIAGHAWRMAKPHGDRLKNCCVWKFIFLAASLLLSAPMAHFSCLLLSHGATSQRYQMFEFSSLDGSGQMLDFVICDGDPRSICQLYDFSFKGSCNGKECRSHVSNKEIVKSMWFLFPFTYIGCGEAKVSAKVSVAFFLIAILHTIEEACFGIFLAIGKCGAMGRIHILLLHVEGPISDFEISCHGILHGIRSPGILRKAI